MSENAEKQEMTPTEVDTSNLPAVPEEEVLSMEQEYEKMLAEQEEESVEETPQETVEEASQEETPETPQLPEFLPENTVVSDDKVTIEGVELDRQYAQDAINWRLKAGKAEWLKQPLGEMDEAQQLAFKTIQSLHGQSEHGKEETHVPEKIKEEYNSRNIAKEFYEDIKNNYPEFMGAVDKKIDEENKQSEIDIQGLIRQHSEGEIDDAQFAAKLTEYEKERETQTQAKISKMVAEEVARNNSEIAAQTRFARISQESQELMSDPRYVEAAGSNLTPDPLDGEMLSPIGRLCKYGDPITGKPLFPKDAYKVYLRMQGDGGNGGFDFGAIQAKPQKSDQVVVEEALTDRQMSPDTPLEDVLSEAASKFGF